MDGSLDQHGRGGSCCTAAYGRCGTPGESARCVVGERSKRRMELPGRFRLHSTPPHPQLCPLLSLHPPPPLVRATVFLACRRSVAVHHHTMHSPLVPWSCVLACKAFADYNNVTVEGYCREQQGKSPVDKSSLPPSPPSPAVNPPSCLVPNVTQRDTPTVGNLFLSTDTTGGAAAVSFNAYLNGRVRCSPAIAHSNHPPIGNQLGGQLQPASEQGGGSFHALNPAVSSIPPILHARTHARTHARSNTTV
jgi:hypothetical protein